MGSVVIYTPEEWGWILGIMGTAAFILYVLAVVILVRRAIGRRGRMLRTGQATPVVSVQDEARWMGAFDAAMAER